MLTGVSGRCRSVPTIPPGKIGRRLANPWADGLIAVCGRGRGRGRRGALAVVAGFRDGLLQPRPDQRVWFSGVAEFPTAVLAAELLGELMRVSLRPIGVLRAPGSVLLLTAGLLAACGTADEVESTASSTAPSLSSVTAPATSPPLSRGLCGEVGEPPAWPVDTIEGLAKSSDLVGRVDSAEDLGNADLTQFGVTGRLLSVGFDQVLRGDQLTRSVVVIDHEHGPQLVAAESSIVFLVEVDDPEIAENVGVEPPVYSLTPGVNSILDVVGDVATSRCGDFFGLLMSDAQYAASVIDPVTSESLVVSTEAVTDSYPVDDVVRIVSDPDLGPRPDDPEFASECIVPIERGARADECTLVDWDLLEVDGASLRLSYFANDPGCSEELDRVEIDETDTSVTLRVVVAFAGDEGASCPTALGSRETTIELAAPLGDRSLFGCRPEGSFAPAGGYNTPEPRSPQLECSPTP